MHTLSHVADDLSFLLKLVACIAFVFGLAASAAAALVGGRLPRLAAIVRVIAAAGPDLRTLVDRCRQARAAFRQTGGPENQGGQGESLLLSVLLDAASCQCTALLEVYRQDCYEALFGTPLKGDPTADEAATKAAFESLDARWAPVWTAWRGLRAAALGASSPGDHASDERELAAAVRAIETILAPPALQRFRALLSRGGDLRGRAFRVRDVDLDLPIIVSARELARRERVKSGALSGP